MITVADVEAARARIGSLVRKTPVMAAAMSREPLAFPGRVTLKLELHQVTGSFKARGAMNRLAATPREDVRLGIVTASGGNHGLAVARTARFASTTATIYVPETVSPAKVKLMRDWGADVRIVGKDWRISNEAALAFADETGAAYFHPFADPLVCAGQGTLGLDLLDEIEDFDTIFVAIGGGGLISGLSTAIKAYRPDVRIIGVEPEGSPTLAASLSAGEVVSLPRVTSKVATMSCGRTEPTVFDLVRRNVEDIVLVSDEEMLAASRRLWSEYSVAADLAGSASMAALLKGHPSLSDARHVCVLVCGAGTEGT